VHKGAFGAFLERAPRRFEQLSCFQVSDATHTQQACQSAVLRVLNVELLEALLTQHARTADQYHVKTVAQAKLARDDAWTLR
jgi:hypothetical protein